VPLDTTRARLAVLAAALLFSTGGAAIKGTTLGALQVAGFRSGVAALALLLLLPEARRGFGRDLLPAALAYAGTLVCFVAATKMTTAAAAIFLQSTAPIWVLVLAPLLLGEPVRRRDLPWVGLAALGLALVFLGSRDPVATAPRPGLGNAIALASGLLYALLMIFFRRLARPGQARDRTMPAAVLGNALAFFLCLPFALPVASGAGRGARLDARRGSAAGTWCGSAAARSSSGSRGRRSSSARRGRRSRPRRRSRGRWSTRGSPRSGTPRCSGSSCPCRRSRRGSCPRAWGRASPSRARGRGAGRSFSRQYAATSGSIAPVALVPDRARVAVLAHRRVDRLPDVPLVAGAAARRRAPAPGGSPVAHRMPTSAEPVAVTGDRDGLELALAEVGVLLP
jgi:drug/metabolite transporter (DMT)-like permease